MASQAFDECIALRNSTRSVLVQLLQTLLTELVKHKPVQQLILRELQAINFTSVGTGVPDVDTTIPVSANFKYPQLLFSFYTWNRNLAAVKASMNTPLLTNVDQDKLDTNVSLVLSQYTSKYKKYHETPSLVLNLARTEFSDLNLREQLKTKQIIAEIDEYTSQLDRLQEEIDMAAVYPPLLEELAVVEPLVTAKSAEKQHLSSMRDAFFQSPPVTDEAKQEFQELPHKLAKVTQEFTDAIYQRDAVYRKLVSIAVAYPELYHKYPVLKSGKVCVLVLGVTDWY